MGYVSSLVQPIRNLKQENLLWLKSKQDYHGTNLSATKSSRTGNRVFEYKINNIQISFLSISLAHPSFIISSTIAVGCVISSWAASAYTSGSGYSSHTGRTDHVIAVSLLTIFIYLFYL